MAKQTQAQRIDKLESGLAQAVSGINTMLEYLSATTPQTPTQTQFTTAAPSQHADVTIKPAVPSQIKGAIFVRNGRIYVGQWEASEGHRDYRVITDSCDAFDTSHAMWTSHAKTWIAQLTKAGFTSSVDDTPEMAGIWASQKQQKLGHAIKKWLENNNLWKAEWTEVELIQQLSWFKELAIANGYEMKQRSTYAKRK